MSNKENAKISSDIQNVYDESYSKINNQWRELGAKYKAENIINVSKGFHFNKVLEAGAGDGSILMFLDKYKFCDNLHALEISKSGIDLIEQKKIKSLKSVSSFDEYKTSYHDKEFDLVILAHVLEHVEHERLLIRELKRISKYQIFEIPLDYRYNVDSRMNHFLGYGHINVYTPSSLRFLLKSEKLEVISDISTLTNPAVNKFNQYINKVKKKNLISSVKIEMEYFLKDFLGKVMGRKIQEKFGNAYTVLTKHDNGELEIFSNE